MSSAVVKFIDYLNQSIEDIKQDLVKEAKLTRDRGIIAKKKDVIASIGERSRIVRLLSTPKDEWDKLAEVFIDFNILSDFLIMSPLKTREQLQVILYMLEKNLATPILCDEADGFDAPAIENFEFKTMTKEEARDMIHSMEYGRLSTADPDDLTEDEIAKYMELKQFIDSNPLDLSYLKELHRNISMHYFEKIDSFDYDDVRAILCVLESFGVPKNMCDSFKYYFEREVKKREPKEEVVIVRDFHKKLDENRITEKEYNLLNRELKKYFDLDDMYMEEPLTIDMQIYCVSLMMKMRISLDTIKKALKVMNRNNKNLSDSVNPIVLFNRLYGRLNYYSENEELVEAISQIMNFFQEIFICSNDDYEFWKSMIGEELEKALTFVPNTYEYEIEEAKKLI